VSRFGYFWALVIVAVGLFYAGVYRNFLAKVAYIWALWGTQLRRHFRVSALSGSVEREVLAQTPIRQRGSAAWARHILISWGFGVLFLFDMLFALLTKYVPSEFFMAGPGRDALDFALDLSGAVLLAGLVLALAVDTGGGRYGDRRAVAFLLVVALSGFVTEAVRLASRPYEARTAYSFLGAAMAAPLRSFPWPWAEVHRIAWVFHATVSSAFLAYLGWSRMIHVLATGVGRVMQSQPEVWRAKVEHVVRGMVGAGERR